MATILESLVQYVPKGKTVRLTMLPEKPVDVWVLSETRMNRVENELNVDSSVPMVDYINVYVRQSPDSTAYSNILSELLSFYESIFGCVNKYIGDYFIIDVTDYNVVPLGRDDKGNYIISLNFILKYEK